MPKRKIPIANLQRSDTYRRGDAAPIGAAPASFALRALPSKSIVDVGTRRRVTNKPKEKGRFAAMANRKNERRNDVTNKTGESRSVSDTTKRAIHATKTNAVLNPERPADTSKTGRERTASPPKTTILGSNRANTFNSAAETRATTPHAFLGKTDMKASAIKWQTEDTI